MVPTKRTVFLLTVYGMKNTVRLIGTLENVGPPVSSNLWSCDYDSTNECIFRK